MRRRRRATYSAREARGEAPGSEKRDDVGWRRRRDGWTVGVGWWVSGRVHRSRLRCRFGVAPHCRRRVRAESDEVVGAVVQHATAPSESEMRDEAMGAVAQRATVPRECESEIEQRLWASASWVITTRASFWVCRCRRPRLARRVNRFSPAC